MILLLNENEINLVYVAVSGGHSNPALSLITARITQVASGVLLSFLSLILESETLLCFSLFYFLLLLIYFEAESHVAQTSVELCV